MTELLDPKGLIARLRDEGGRRYHDLHPFNVRMHDGKLTNVDGGLIPS